MSGTFDWSDPQLCALRARFAARLVETRRTLAASADPAPAREAAHRLKGSAPMYGFDALGAAAAQTEAQLRAGGSVASALPALLAALDDAVTRDAST